MKVLSKFELNKGIAEELGFKVDSQGLVPCQGVWINTPEGGPSRWFDCLSNWNDLMPLVVEYSLSSIDRREDGYNGTGRYMVQSVTVDEDQNYWFIESFGDNLQRALAECLLKILKEMK